jgi:hypothetical protein
VCAALGRQRAEAEKDGDIRRATTLEIEMRGHHALRPVKRQAGR